ncbi:DUF6745 domain-containing protein [Actinomadura scrupuli]|uniref:DUF6745 domain-containing protein n=1 Tax=Actinomadura scrupuli TaxID=559629 RepID=UPI003D96E7F3
MRDWREIAFRTGPADRDRAERGIRAAYEAAGRPGPERIAWVPSPAHGAVAAALLADPGCRRTLMGAGLSSLVDLVDVALGTAAAGGSVREDVRTRPWDRARTTAHAELGPREWPKMWAGTGGRLWDPVNGLVTRIRRGIGELGGAEAEAVLRGATLDAVHGQHDAPWLALFDALDRLDGLAGLAEVAESAGWWWPYENLAVVSERPRELHRDEPGRLHRGDGPALVYPGGFALYAWRGMPMPADFIDGLDALTPERIGAETNAELRRVMLERYGFDRYLAETGAKPISRDDAGVLWRIDLPGDEPVVMVEVVNSTPEPDGTHLTYWLRVPPRTRTAHEGVAWTFGLSPGEYQPLKQT